MNSELAQLFEKSVQQSSNDTLIVPVVKSTTSVFSNTPAHTKVPDIGDSDGESPAAVSEQSKKKKDIKKPEVSTDIKKEEEVKRPLSNAERRILNKEKKRERKAAVEQGVEPVRKKQKAEEDPEKRARTVFVGNVSKLVKTDKATQGRFKKLFSDIGQLESVRFRSIAFKTPANKSEQRRREFIASQLGDQKDTFNAYIVFHDRSCALKSADLNGVVFEEKHLRVDVLVKEEDIAAADRREGDEEVVKRNPKKRSVFVGNLPLDVAEEQLWTLFEKCGTILNVRVIRDKTSSVGKGIAYVEFKERSSIPLAKKLNGRKVGNRPIRVQKCGDSEKIKAEKKAKEKETKSKLLKTKSPAPAPGKKKTKGFQGRPSVNNIKKTKRQLSK